MRTLRAVPVEDVDLTPYGRLFDLADGTAPRVVVEASADWQDRYTAEPVVTGPVHLGMTTGPALAVGVTRMERHPHTHEALACLAAPVVLPLSADPGERPAADTVVAVVLRPGQCVSLHPGVWHSACLGIDGPAAYYWLAGVSDSAPSPWADVVDGPLRIEAPAGHADG